MPKVKKTKTGRARQRDDLNLYEGDVDSFFGRKAKPAPAHSRRFDDDDYDPPEPTADERSWQAEQAWNARHARECNDPNCTEYHPPWVKYGGRARRALSKLAKRVSKELRRL